MGAPPRAVRSRARERTTAARRLLRGPSAARRTGRSRLPLARHELMAKIDPEVLAHLEWLGFVQPVGLVVSAPALVRAGCILDRRDAAVQELLRAALDPDAPEDEPRIADFEDFT